MPRALIIVLAIVNLSVSVAVASRGVVGESLVQCEEQYRAAVDQYRSGHEDEAMAGIAALDRDELQAVVEAIVAVRAAPPKKAKTANSKAATSTFVWDGEQLLAAARLHVNLFVAAGKDPDAGAGWHVKPARAILGAFTVVRPEQVDEVALRGARASVLLELFDSRFFVARQRFADAIGRWPTDLNLLLLGATEQESEATQTHSVGSSMPMWYRNSSDPRALQADPVTRARANRADSLRKAAALLERVLVLDSSLVEANVRLAHVLMLQHKDDQALSILDRVLAASPPTDWSYIVRLLEGELHARSGRSEQARQQFASALAAQPGAQSAILALSQLMYSTGDSEAARTVLDELFDGRDHAAADPWSGYPLGRPQSNDRIVARLRVELHP